MLDIKEKKLIQYLLKHKSTFLTGKDLANYMSCSDRTARTYMKRLSEYLDAESGLRILSKQGSGYQLIIEDETLYFQFLSKNNIYFGLENIEITDRHNYILNKLIFEQDCLLFDDLSEELFVSRSTLSSDFKKIREILEKYNLLVESKPNRGVFVSGREQDKRHFIMDYFFSGQFLKNIHHYMSEDVLDLPISFEELTIIVVDECRNGNLGLSDFVIQNLVIHIALAIKRMRDGFDLAPIILSEDKVQLEIAIAQNILRRVRFITQIDFPEEEANYIALHLISKATHDSGSDEHGVNLRQDIMASLSLLEQSDLYSFSNDLTLVEGLSKHLEVLVERIKNGIHLENPLLDDLKAHYSDVFTLSRDFLRNLPSLKSILLSEDELAYIFYQLSSISML
ncbi:BglG family transcription antiterminator [Streptococcus loxodontisalivarius]|uniref:Transcriptional antiterminator n=1 Tax=Streptococcus loxodontisalivarius TaxID=1349415 RepID=A0ABS2PWN6_9STRE|nr:transcription antiterminator [Streptococcus loxodontisalivarius]MBM7643702.1 transcriptional antiterminator [Streptococcus loxodontisalivarius]